MGRMGCHIISKLGKCQSSFPTFLSIIVEDMELLFEGLDSSFTEAISLRVIDSTEA